MVKALGDGAKAAALSFALGKGAEKLSGALKAKAAARAAKAADKLDEAAKGGEQSVKLLTSGADKLDEAMKGADKIDEVMKGADKLDDIANNSHRGIIGRVKEIPGKIKAIPGKVAAIPGKVAAIPGKVANAAVHSVQTIGANGLPQVTAQGLAGAVVTTTTTGGGADTRLTDFQVDAGTVKAATREATVTTYGDIVDQAMNGPHGQTGTDTSSLFGEPDLAQVVRPDLAPDPSPTNPPAGSTGGTSPGGGGGPSGGYTPSVPTVAPTTPWDTTPTTIPTVEPSTISPTTISPTTVSPSVDPIIPTVKQPGTGTTTHGGGGYGETGYTGGDGPEAMGASLSELLDDSDSSIDEIIKGSKYSRIPTSSKPILNSDTVSSASVIPLAAGLSVASAAGLAAKAYIDHKKATEEEEEEEDGEEYEYGQYDDINVDNWSASDEDIAAAQIEVGEDEFINVDRQDDDEYYRVMDNPLPVMGVDELEEY